MTNPYCETLGIEVPKLEAVTVHREAKTFPRLIVALLERGASMTLEEVALRFEAAGIASANEALRSLKRCRPARPPVYREQQQYALDPYDEELERWLFRLDLRPPKGKRVPAAPSPPTPLPGPDQALTNQELDEAWKGANLDSWSKQRLALAVLDAHGEAMAPGDVVAVVNRRTQRHDLTGDSRIFQHRGAAVAVLEDGRWAPIADHPALQSARTAVRKRIEVARRNYEPGLDPEVIAANIRAAEQRRLAHTMELASLRRVIVHGYPAKAPRAVVLLDIDAHRISTYMDDRLAAAGEALARYDVIAGLEVRPLLRALGVDPGKHRLAELGPPQKTKKLNRQGRTLKITPALLIQGSCGISKPLGDPKKLDQYLSEGQSSRLLRRLESDAKSLYALYQYGRLHGHLWLRWGFLEEALPVPWVHMDEVRLYGLKRHAHETGTALEVVIGNAPAWGEPWSRAVRCFSKEDKSGYGYILMNEEGYLVDDREIQSARLAVVTH